MEDRKRACGQCEEQIDDNSFRSSLLGDPACNDLSSMEKFLWCFDAVCVLISFLERDCTLRSIISLSKDTETSINRNNYLWMMLCGRKGCTVCFLEAKYSMKEYLIDDAEQAEFWKQICKMHIAARRIRRQWRINFASRVLLKEGNDAEYLKNIKYQCKTSIAPSKSPKSNNFALSHSSSQSITNPPNLISKIQKSLNLFKPKTHFYSDSRKIWSVTESPYLSSSTVSASHNGGCIKPHHLDKLLDKFLFLEGKDLLRSDPGSKHMHDQISIPQSWKTDLFYCDNIATKEPHYFSAAQHRLRKGGSSEVWTVRRMSAWREASIAVSYCTSNSDHIVLWQLE